jgi:HSP20 family protein
MFGGSGSENPYSEMNGILRSIFNVGDIASVSSTGGRGFLASSSRGSWLPPMNLMENQTQFVMSLDVAGLKRDDMEVNIKDGRVCVKGTRRDVEAALSATDDSARHGGQPTDGRIYHMYERGFGSFERCVSLPSRVREDSVSAQFLDGVLSVSMDKEESGMQRGSPISIR